MKFMVDRTEKAVESPRRGPKATGAAPGNPPLEFFADVMEKS